MPALNWIGKDKIVNHHQEVPFKILEHEYGFTDQEGKITKETESGNKIIHGDNLEALKSLLPEYEGKINCIYIDPPYNTGNEKWIYNDNVSHPRFNKWLGEVVGKEGDDLSRHDKWLCMMYPRLKLLHKLLDKDGVIFISIDDNEQANLKLICDEIFGYKNCIGPIIQNKLNSKNDTANIQKNHEFILAYRKRELKSKNSKGNKSKPNLINYSYSLKKVFKEGNRFFYLKDPITTRGEGGILNARENLGFTVYYNPDSNEKIAIEDYDIELAKTSNNIIEIYNTDQEKLKEGFVPIRPPRVRGKLGAWTWSLDKFNLEKDKIFITGKKGSYSVKKRTFVKPSDVIHENGSYYYKQYKKGNSKSIINFSTNEGTKELNMIMKESGTFDNPKNVSMLEYLISLVPKKNSIILDSFAGSGTTAQAVMNLNKKDNGNRKYILIEMEDYAETLTSFRTQKIIQGYQFKGKSKKVFRNYTVNITNLKKSHEILEEFEKIKRNNNYEKVSIESIDDKISITGVENIEGKVEGLGGKFDFYTLGTPLFDDNHNLNEEVGIDKIREYIWYSETRIPFQEMDKTKPFLGSKDETDYYFIYNKNEPTTLDYDALSIIQRKAGQYIIYADNCLLSKEFLSKHKIIFKKIPRDITKF